MARLTNKRIKKARTVYETYCKLNTLEKTKQSTGLAINTIRRYIALIEGIDNKSKLSTKDRYYSNSTYNNNKDIYIEAPPPYIDIDYNNINNICQEENNNNLEINNNSEEIGQIISDNSDVEVFTANEIPSLKETKNKILLGKLDTIAFKYLEYLDNPSDADINKTSLKDRAVIAGILLDKKILMEHKQGDVIKNQSIIIGLFGTNTKLAEFIAGSVKRTKTLQSRPVQKYIPAVNK